MRKSISIFILIFVLWVMQGPSRTWVNVVATAPDGDICLTSSPLDSLRELDSVGTLVRKMSMVSDGDFSPMCWAPYYGWGSPAGAIAEGGFTPTSLIYDITYLTRDLSSWGQFWGFASSPSDSFDVGSSLSDSTNVEAWGLMIVNAGGDTDVKLNFRLFDRMPYDNFMASTGDTIFNFAGDGISTCTAPGMIHDRYCFAGNYFSVDPHKLVTAFATDPLNRLWVGAGDSVKFSTSVEGPWTSHYLGWTPKEIIVRDTNWIEAWSSNIRKDGIVHPLHMASWKNGVWSEAGLDANGSSKTYCPVAGDCFVVHQSLAERKATIYREHSGVVSDSFTVNRWILDMAATKGLLYLGTDSGLVRLDTLTHGVSVVTAAPSGPSAVVRNPFMTRSTLSVLRQGEGWRVQCPGPGRLEMWSLQGRRLGSLVVTASPVIISATFGRAPVMFRWVGVHGKVQSALAVGW